MDGISSKCKFVSPTESSMKDNQESDASTNIPTISQTQMSGKILKLVDDFTKQINFDCKFFSETKQKCFLNVIRKNSEKQVVAAKGLVFYIPFNFKIYLFLNYKYYQF